MKITRLEPENRVAAAGRNYGGALADMKVAAWLRSQAKSADEAKAAQAFTEDCRAALAHRSRIYIAMQASG